MTERGGIVSQSPRGYKILLAIALGFILGLVVGSIIAGVIGDKTQRAQITIWFRAFGDIFVRLIRIIISILIFFTISAATSSIANARGLGTILVWMLVL